MSLCRQWDTEGRASFEKRLWWLGDGALVFSKLTAILKEAL